jgi:hypothetical protein
VELARASVFSHAKREACAVRRCRIAQHARRAALHGAQDGRVRALAGAHPAARLSRVRARGQARLAHAVGRLNKALGRQLRHGARAGRHAERGARRAVLRAARACAWPKAAL